MNIDVHVDELAQIIFLDNPKRTRYFLTFDDVDNIKDLFFFMLDLLCKGLVLLHGNGGDKINIHHLDKKMFDEVSDLLTCAGIRAKLEVSSMDEPTTSTETNMNDIMRMNPNSSLDDFKFQMRHDRTQYEISFELMR